MDNSYIVALVIIILLVLFFNKEICQFAGKARQTMAEAVCKSAESKPAYSMPDDDTDKKTSTAERMTDPTNGNIVLPPGQTSDTLTALGYTGAPWSEILGATELDPSLYVSHMDFVKDVRRLSSGANFTAVTDDNTNTDFVNFRGLQRPMATPNMIGKDARSVPDIDEDVLLRNKHLKFN